jgi:tRNA(Ile)-lysidine synthase
MLERVAGTISRYSMFASGENVGVAVSGGIDSVCLLLVLHELLPASGARLSVLHLNHGLRGEDSDADAEFVEKLAGSLGLSFYGARADIANTSGNLEQEARRARMAFFAAAQARNGIHKVATGHTASDQAETVIFRLLRGSGTAGLAGILPTLDCGLVRPLLECERSEIESWMLHKNASWRLDASNADERFARNRIRNTLLPEIIKNHSPSVVAILASTANIARDEEFFWDRYITDVALAVFRRRANAIVIPVDQLSRYPPAVVRRLLRRAVLELKKDLRGLNVAHVDQIMRLALDNRSSGRVQAPGIDAFRSFEWLRLSPLRTGGSRSDANYSILLAPPCVVNVGGTNIRLDVVDFPLEGYTENSSLLDLDRADGPLELRNWYPGDKYERPGYSENNIKEMFQVARIPLWDRQTWPILTINGKIAWSKNFGIASQFAPSGTTRRVLRIVADDATDSSESNTSLKAS